MKGAILFLEPRGTALEVVRTAKNRGYTVIGLSSDRRIVESAALPYRTAISCFDHIEDGVSWTDLDSVRAKAKSIDDAYGLRGVYSAGDPSAEALAVLRTQFGLPSPTPEAIRGLLNKRQLRKRLGELSLSKLGSLSSVEARALKDWPFSGAAFFKPVHGFFSAYVKRCENLEDLKKAEEAWRLGMDQETPFIRDYLHRERDFHLEEAFEGELLSLEAISSGGRLIPLGVLSRILFSKDPTVEMGSCFPYPHPLEKTIVSRVEAALRGLGYTDGPSHTELIVNSKGEIEIIDLNPRFVGADVLQSINFAFGCSIEESLLDFAIGKEISIAPSIKRYSCLQYVLPPAGLVQFDAIQFPSDVNVPFTASFLSPGTLIQSSERQLDYLGCYLTTQSSFDEAILYSRNLRDQVLVNQNMKGSY